MRFLFFNFFHYFWKSQIPRNRFFLSKKEKKSWNWNWTFFTDDKLKLWTEFRHMKMSHSSDHDKMEHMKKELEHLHCKSAANSELCLVISKFFSTLDSNEGDSFQLIYDDLPIYYVPESLKQRAFLFANIFTKWVFVKKKNILSYIFCDWFFKVPNQWQVGIPTFITRFGTYGKLDKVEQSRTEGGHRNSGYPKSWGKKFEKILKKFFFFFKKYQKKISRFFRDSF